MNVSLALSLLASSSAELPLPTKVPGTARDTLIVLIAVSAVGLLLLGVLTVWVKSRRSRHRPHRPHRPHRTDAKLTETSPAETDAELEVEPGTHRHRRRKRRRDHRPRNPTLAETGGFPPPRPEGQVPPGL